MLIVGDNESFATVGDLMVHSHGHTETGQMSCESAEFRVATSYEENAGMRKGIHLPYLNPNNRTIIQIIKLLSITIVSFLNHKIRVKTTVCLQILIDIVP